MAYENRVLIKSLIEQGMDEVDAKEYSRIVMSSEIENDEKWKMIGKLVDKWVKEHTKEK